VGGGGEEGWGFGWMGELVSNCMCEQMGGCQCVGGWVMSERTKYCMQQMHAESKAFEVVGMVPMHTSPSPKAMSTSSNCCVVAALLCSNCTEDSVHQKK